ncbi:hypothetical protein BHU72_06710 [Desulfuribacillus stibiiarsenatis]|uniref:Type I-B CRISPR-associated protein Cas8b1/Cst1 n=1 Tax=Desulfuribacillus stibiiarsenatis TaxID=1390249 RepID=A0A1E5L411_9FIRM|nr:hypothetical protein [Desulfuribacillus stibiiarsenatis]OEH84880.1 hypothetical protein BHU72_06710 [Desulfuribacillus stibiiarsenatis]
MGVQVDAEEWPIIAGLIGLIRVVGKEEIAINRNGIAISKENLEDLASKMVYKLIETFNVVERDVEKMRWYSTNLVKNPDKLKLYATEVKKIIAEQLKKIEKYFGDTDECQQVRDLVEKLKEINDTQSNLILEDVIDQYKKIASTSFIKEKLTLNYVKSVILSPFFGQTSILQPVFSSRNTEEHIIQIDKDFVMPALIELELHNLLKSEENIDGVVKYLDQTKDGYQPFREWYREIKKMKDPVQLKQYLSKQVLKCSFIDSLLATQTYEEMMFSPLAFSNNNAVNFNWDFEKKQPIPMSAVARLILFLSPLGMTFYNRKRGSQQSTENLRFAGLIMTEESFEDVLSYNNTYRMLRSKNSSFEEAIVGVLEESVDKAERIYRAFQFLEVHSESKKTLLDYYHMPMYLVHYLKKYGKSLRLIQNREIRDEYLRTLLKGIDPKKAIFELLRESISNSFYGEGAYIATRERLRVLNAKKGVKEMTKDDKLITAIYFHGVELREALFQDKGSNEEGVYRASGRKKMEGIAYRLINAIKAGNKQAFMDTIFRLYIGAKDLRVPSFFVNAFKEDGLEFETIGSAFVAGMLGQEISRKEKEGAVNNG